MNSRSFRFAALWLAGPLTLGGCGGDDPFAVSTAPTVDVALARRIQLSPEASARAAIGEAIAGPDTLARTLVLPGSIRFAEDRRAAVLARLDGVIVEVQARLGDRVESGKLLAVLHSRELARARTAYIEAAYLQEFSRIALEREERLRAKRISSEEDYLRARHALEEAGLELRATREELKALGVGAEELARLSDTERLGEETMAELELARFERRAPIGGVVVEKNAVLGEAVRADGRLFEVADLTTVWVDLRVRAADLVDLAPGRPVTVISRDLGREHDAKISYLDSQVQPDTQTALARIELANEDGAWRPGLYVTVRATIGEHLAPVVVPAEAVHHLGTGAVVFVAHGEGAWEAREVSLGQRDEHRCQISDGLEPGETVAMSNGLLLKSVWLSQEGEGN